MRSPRFRFVVAALCTLLTLVCTGCQQQIAKKPAISSVTLGTFSKALGNTPYHVAKHFGWFSDTPLLRGIEFRFTEFNDRPTISQALDKGELQVLFSAEVPAILCRIQGNDIRIVELSAFASQEILVRAKGTVRTVEDLKGKSLAVLQGTSSHYCLLKILQAHGMTPADLDLRYMAAPEAKVAFESGQLEAWAVWAPWVEQQEVTGKGRVVTGGDAVINSTMTMPRSLIEDHPELAGALIGVIRRAKDWIVSHPAEAQAIAASELGLDSAVVRQAWPKFQWGARLTEGLLSDFQDKADFLASQDKTRASRTLDVRAEMVDLRFSR